MRINRLALALLLDDVNNFLAVPEEDMANGSTDSQVGTELVENLGRGEPRETDCSEFGLVKTEIIIENEELVVIGTILVEESLGEEGEVLGFPGVGSVGSAESDTIDMMCEKSCLIDIDNG